jgi:hypothetical protein
MRQVLTDSALRGLKPRATPFKVTDGGGLYVLVTPSGAKYWRYNYVLGGKAKTLALGRYPSIKLGRRARPTRPRPAFVEAKPFGQLLRDVAAYSGRQGNVVGKALVLLALPFVRPGTMTQAEWVSSIWIVRFGQFRSRS